MYTSRYSTLGIVYCICSVHSLVLHSRRVWVWVCFWATPHSTYPVASGTSKLSSNSGQHPKSVCDTAPREVLFLVSFACIAKKSPLAPSSLSVRPSVCRYKRGPHKTDLCKILYLLLVINLSRIQKFD